MRWVDTGRERDFVCRLAYAFDREDCLFTGKGGRVPLAGVAPRWEARTAWSKAGR